jgi:hypothetical protein
MWCFGATTMGLQVATRSERHGKKKKKKKKKCEVKRGVVYYSTEYCRCGL